MKQVNLALMLAVIVGAVAWKIATRDKGTVRGATGGTQVPPMIGSAEVDPITEAAYHQGSSDFASATGPDENISGEEVISQQ